MATYLRGRQKLQVQFLVPAPIFVFFLLFFLCGSACAVDFNENELYPLSDFPVWLNSSTSISSAVTYSSDIPAVNANNQYIWAISNSVRASSGGAGSVPLTSLDTISNNFRFCHISWISPRIEGGSLAFGQTVLPSILYRSTSSSDTSSHSFGIGYDTNGYAIVTTGNSNYINLYYSSATYFTNHIKFDAYVSIRQDRYFAGFYVQYGRPTGVSGAWRVNPGEFTFEFSSSKLYPPANGSGGSGGSVDLSGITSQITQLSSDMAAQFLQVNNNIDSAETSITTSIDNQTTALESALDDQTSAIESAVSDAASDITSNFNNWDNSLSSAYSPEQADNVSSANSSVSDLHEFEDERFGYARDDVGLTGIGSYDLPSWGGALSNIGQMCTLLFNTLSWVSPVVIFSCTLGLALVLLGRKSRGGD